MTQQSFSFKPDQTKIAVYIGLLTLIVSFLATLLFVGDPDMVKITADKTIWRFELLTAYISVAVGLIGYRLLAYDVAEASNAVKSAKRPDHKVLPYDWVGAVVVAIAIAWVLTAACQAFFRIGIERLFPDAYLPRAV